MDGLPEEEFELTLSVDQLSKQGIQLLIESISNQLLKLKLKLII